VGPGTGKKSFELHGVEKGDVKKELKTPEKINNCQLLFF
jgi:hypothetical protein